MQQRTHGLAWSCLCSSSSQPPGTRVRRRIRGNGTQCERPSPPGVGRELRLVGQGGEVPVVRRDVGRVTTTTSKRCPARAISPVAAQPIAIPEPAAATIRRRAPRRCGRWRRPARPGAGDRQRDPRRCRCPGRRRRDSRVPTASRSSAHRPAARSGRGRARGDPPRARGRGILLAQRVSDRFAQRGGAQASKCRARHRPGGHPWVKNPGTRAPRTAPTQQFRVQGARRPGAGPRSAEATSRVRHQFSLKAGRARLQQLGFAACSAAITCPGHRRGDRLQAVAASG